MGDESIGPMGIFRPDGWKLQGERIQNVASGAEARVDYLCRIRRAMS